MTGCEERPRSFMTRLARDTRGNTLAIMAAALIPLAGMVGSGIDVARMYLTKTRLQHACDAAALAGRKAMGGGQWSQGNNMPAGVANQFFAANFATGSYGSGNLKSGFAENAGKVTGTASADLPMTLTRVIGARSVNLAVSCEAEMRLPNTDVMFVLDNTGSMGDKAVSSDSQTKIQALRSAVKCFYEIVARQDTDEECVGGAPSGGLSDQVQVRFGFVPYTTNVRVGYLLKPEWLADQWPYQSRELATLYGTWNSYDGLTLRNGKSWSGWVSTGATINAAKADCNGTTPPDDTYTANGNPTSWPDSETSTSWRAYAPYIQVDFRYYWTNNACRLQSQQRNVERRSYYDRASSNGSGALPFSAWAYKQVTLNVSGLKNGSNWNSSVVLPVGDNGTNVAAKWDGCIEERRTVRQDSYDPIPDGALDLDLKSAPTGNVDTQWGPALPSVIYPRRNSYDNSGSYTLDTVTNFYQRYSGEAYYCPTAAHKLEKWGDADQFDSYVDSLSAGGNTYHDIGLIWGARLMWPTGIFRSENEYTPQGGEIQRHMIFMTDGDACTSVMNYQAYGLAWYDRRQTDPSIVPTDGCTTTGTLTEQVNARTQALCTRIKNEQITLWVIWFGQKNATIENMMKKCATTDRYFAARNQADLQNTFRSIANQISQLRLTN
ncbi:Flp pilus assembly protein TadG [Sphingomonas gellani]|uniref:Flp pilus assembly protein TadG n=1 Tax=Sphingomonas gellani TaxID=1166340 RepID=A0A1H8EYB2_9SPHN|nr:TadE/TadG family type IV pilus assembly protein [Sphingomonas gellani]SEN23867.1 Flp pilus assembly protein TadG [Sphingomonas gellani]